uniref:Uncharacterized protein n=1 Tax=Parascaris equorum TaxID=6256 RepID=A0A914S5U2_PAREQ
MPAQNTVCRSLSESIAHATFVSLCKSSFFRRLT